MRWYTRAADGTISWSENLSGRNYFDTNNIVRRTYISDGEVVVSTIFLGIDHSWPINFDDPDHEPVLWETMVFGEAFDKTKVRYTSEGNAIHGHEEMVKKIREAEREMMQCHYLNAMNADVSITRR